MTDALGRMVEAGDRDRWVAARLAGPRARLPMAVYAFDLELSRIPLRVSEPLLGEMRFQFWRDAVAAICEGGAVPGHEVAGPLAEAAREAGLPRAMLETLIAARRRALEAEGAPARADLDRDLAETAGTVMALAARALGGGENTDAVAADLGYADGAARLLRASPGQGSRPEASTLRDAAMEGLDRLARARARRREVPPQAAPAFFAAWRAGPTLRRALRPDFDPEKGIAPRSAFAERGALMLRVLAGRW